MYTADSSIWMLTTMAPAATPSDPARSMRMMLRAIIFTVTAREVTISLLPLANALTTARPSHLGRTK